MMRQKNRASLVDRHGTEHNDGNIWITLSYDQPAECQGETYDGMYEKRFAVIDLPDGYKAHVTCAIDWDDRRIDHAFEVQHHSSTRYNYRSNMHTKESVTIPSQRGYCVLTPSSRADSGYWHMYRDAIKVYRRQGCSRSVAETMARKQYDQQVKYLEDILDENHRQYGWNVVITCPNGEVIGEDSCWGYSNEYDFEEGSESHRMYGFIEIVKNAVDYHVNENKRMIFETKPHLAIIQNFKNLGVIRT